MLESLHVKNLALIDETEVHFKEGLNILSGETGAGKSIILGSIQLALGGRTDKELIRTGAEYALVELIFYIESHGQRKAIEALDIPIEDDGMLLIQRRIMPQKSICKIGGETVTAKTCKDLASILIHIYGQHEHQTLLDKKNYLHILDEYAYDKIGPVLKELQTAFGTYTKLKDEVEHGKVDDTSRNREIFLIQYELEEIEEAELIDGEDIELEKIYEKMIHAQKINEAVASAYGHTSSMNGAGDLVARSVRELKCVQQYDATINDFLEQLETVDSILGDLNRQLSMYADDLEFDEESFHNCETRLNTINHLKAKYGNTITEILSYYETEEKRLQQLLDYESYQLQLGERYIQAEKEVYDLSEQIHTIRMTEKGKLESQLKQSLVDLNFLTVEFEIKLTKKEEPSATGLDQVDFLISTNLGEKLRPMNQIASGGELSRIMLGLKVILANKDQVNTLIFDEIDAGISGKTAWKVAEKLAVLSKVNQVICITHLPQIAAMADYHYLIEKTADSVETTTKIMELNELEQLTELGRLLSGDYITDSVMQNAKELKDLATKTKHAKVN